uniref:Uncharacterized protein n=1 Tax=Mycena chlorophos TaxID=658473 RepID=A0ABQ0LDT0_MYCCL|nr:predicted protein [Mycena chlorophos]
MPSTYRGNRKINFMIIDHIRITVDGAIKLTASFQTGDITSPAATEVRQDNGELKTSTTQGVIPQVMPDA